MAIKVGGTTVIDDSRNLVNIASGAGSSTTFGDVGTYTAAVYADPTTGVRRAAGYTVAGSLLRHVSSSSTSMFAEFEVHDYQTTSAGLSGTWRLMNTALRIQSDRGTAAILVRIS